MTPEELLKPRYKVIALWVKAPIKLIVGDILRHDGLTNDFYCKGERFVRDDVESFPHLFRKLHWSSNRTPDELPKYIGFKNEDGNFNWVCPIVKWINTDNINDPLSCIISFSNLDGNYEERETNQFDLSPATETEYNEYKLKLKTNE